MIQGTNHSYVKYCYVNIPLNLVDEFYNWYVTADVTLKTLHIGHSVFSEGNVYKGNNGLTDYIDFSSNQDYLLFKLRWEGNIIISDRVMLTL